MIIENWFPTPVMYSYAPKDIHQKIVTEYLAAENEIKKDLTTDVWGDRIETTYNLQANVIKKHNLNSLNDYIQVVASEFSRNLDPNKTDLKIDASWVNYFGPGQFEEQHTHLPNYISGVYYIATNKQDGNLRFYKPSVAMGLNYSEFTKVINYAPEESKIILFPSWVEHSVCMNKTDNTRISIAFNLN